MVAADPWNRRDSQRLLLESKRYFLKESIIEKNVKERYLTVNAGERSFSDIPPHSPD